MIKYDCDAWKAYPEHRHWFNKLWLATIMGYRCGPCGVAPDVTGEYCVRPIYNLCGMGVGAQLKVISAGDTTQVPPGYFWTEWFDGVHKTVDYVWDDNRWRPTNCWIGINKPENLSRFVRWDKTNECMPAPLYMNTLSDVEHINIEFIGSKVVEVHLRGSTDPKATAFVPIWEDQADEIEKFESLGYEFIDDYDDADGFLEIPRLGFCVK